MNRGKLGSGCSSEVTFFQLMFLWDPISSSKNYHVSSVSYETALPQMFLDLFIQMTPRAIEFPSRVHCFSPPCNHVLLCGKSINQF